MEKLSIYSQAKVIKLLPGLPCLYEVIEAYKSVFGPYLAPFDKVHDGITINLHRRSSLTQTEVINYIFAFAKFKI